MNISSLFKKLGIISLSLFSVNGWSHFQLLIPSVDIVTPNMDKTVHFKVQFTHPMEGGPVMNMEQPVRLGVLAGVTHSDLQNQLKEKIIDGKKTYEFSYTLAVPVDHVFYLQPAPYWEPAEGIFITHYTKVVVNGFGAETGWDALAGLPVEIEPLVRPYGLWTGNSFRGIVRKDGQPVPFATVEVEYLNEDNTVKIPSDPFITQVIKTDEHGVFSYTMPRAGWWGFAALVEGPAMQTPEGKEVGHEWGALMWVKAVDMPTGKPEKPTKPSGKAAKQ